MKYFPENNESHGYFYYLATNFSSNLEKHVSISYSSMNNGTVRDPYSIIYNIDGKSSSFMTNYSLTENQWILIEFKHILFSFESYYIKSPKHFPNEWPLLRCWNIYGSQNKNKWYLLDQRETDVLNNYSASASFQCQYNCNQYYRYLALYQSDFGFNSSFGFGINRMDLFGSFIRYRDIAGLCICTIIGRHISISPLFFFGIALS